MRSVITLAAMLGSERVQSGVIIEERVEDKDGGHLVVMRVKDSQGNPLFVLSIALNGKFYLQVFDDLGTRMLSLRDANLEEYNV